MLTVPYMPGDDLEIDPSSPVYVYVQVADHVESLIRRGKLKSGARLGSEYDMALQYGVARMTVRRAVRELRERGLVVTVFGKGTFVK